MINKNTKVEQLEKEVGKVNKENNTKVDKELEKVRKEKYIKVNQLK